MLISNNLCFKNSFLFNKLFTNIKTEKEKMLNEELYNANDEELLNLRQKARNLIFEFNNSHPNELNKRKDLLQKIFNTKNDFFIEPPLHVDYGINTKIGDGTFFNFNCIILDVCNVEIGEKCLIAPNVSILTATHPIDPKIRLTGLELCKKIKIGNNVWLGGGCIICPGVKIGNNVTIGAGSVVNKNIPDNSVAVGNPIKIIKKV